MLLRILRFIHSGKGIGLVLLRLVVREGLSEANGSTSRVRLL